jgi:RNA methyltransferase, TrmH family
VTPTTFLGVKHPLLQRLRRLFGRRSFRYEEGVFVIEGVKLLREAMAAGSGIEAVYVDAERVHDAPIAQCIRDLNDRKIRVHIIEPGGLAKVADAVSPQPIAATIAMFNDSFNDVMSRVGRTGFVVLCVDLQDPGNAGTIIRSAESAGAAGVLLCGESVDTTNPKTVRSTAGALFHLPVVNLADPIDAIERLHAASVVTWATEARLPNTVDYDLADLRGPVAFVMGNEANGLSEHVRAGVNGLLTIPMVGFTESLNVGVAASILCFEAARQRRMTDQ